jgi:hypothetical protein
MQQYIFTVQQHKDARCHIADGRGIPFETLYSYANGKLCNAGCAYFEGGRCAAYKKLVAAGDRPISQAPTETVRQQAERMGISISEVRRLRQQQN